MMQWLTNRWVSTAASIWIQWSCGATYTFSIYSSVLKSSQGYDQSTLDTVSVFKDIGANVGILSGLLYSAVTPHGNRHDNSGSSPSNSKLKSISGPWIVLAVGAVQFLGFLFMWAAVVGLIHRPPVAVMCFFAWLGSHGQTFLNTANVVTALRNFPDYGGTVVGIMKGFLGLSGAILIQLYHAFCDGDPTTYLLMLAVFPTLVCLLLMCLVRIYEGSNVDVKRHLNGISSATAIIVAYLMLTIILQNFFTFPSWARIFTFLVLVGFLASPFGIAVIAQLEDSGRFPLISSIERNPLISYSTSAAPSCNPPSADLMGYDKPSGGTSSENMFPDEEEEEMNLLQAMCTLDFWLLFTAMVSGLGSGLATINNMSQIGQSLGYTPLEINNLVSLWSMWNFLGRFGGGYVSDYMMHSRGWPRPFLMCIALATMIIGHLTIASGLPGNLYLGPVLVGICYGANWCLMPTITSEIFGVKHMGTIFNTIAAASPLGSYILSVGVVGYIYDKEANKEDNSCTGSHCFMISFLILAAVAFVAFLVGVALCLRTRRFYKVVVLRRLHHTGK